MLTAIDIFISTIYTSVSGLTVSCSIIYIINNSSTTTAADEKEGKIDVNELELMINEDDEDDDDERCC